MLSRSCSYGKLMAWSKELWNFGDDDVSRIALPSSDNIVILLRWHDHRIDWPAPHSILINSRALPWCRDRVIAKHCEFMDPSNCWMMMAWSGVPWIYYYYYYSAEPPQTISMNISIIANWPSFKVLLTFVVGSLRMYIYIAMISSYF